MVGEEAPAVRPYGSDDLVSVAGLVGDERAVEQERHRAHVAAHDARAGVAVWIETSDRQGVLSLVATDPRLVSANNARRLFYELALACARDALGRGVERGRFTLRDARVVAMVEKDFNVVARGVGRNPRTGVEVGWEVVVDVATVVRQLEAWLRYQEA